MGKDDYMSANSIIPYLLYEDAATALKWLTDAFGFREHLRFVDKKTGRVTHAEIRIGDNAIMLGEPGPDYRNPKRLGGNSVEIAVYVDNVDSHFTRAKTAGANIVSEPKDEAFGDRGYRAKDPEGQTWYFAQHLRNVPPEEWGAVLA